MGRILIGNIKGPQGLQGPQGIQGPVGPQGPLPPLVNNGLTTEVGIAALDAAMGKTLSDNISELNSRIIITDITDESDGAGRIGTGFSTLHHFIIGAQLMSPRLNEQAYVNVSSNPIDFTIFVDCPEHKNETITVKLIVYKFA